MADRGKRNNNETSYEVPKPLRVSNILIRLWYLWTIFGVVVLSLRVVLLAFSANRATGFVTFIYETSDRYLEPFRQIFPSRHIGNSGYLDVSAIFAILVYILVLWGIMALIEFVEHKMHEVKSSHTLVRGQSTQIRDK